MLNLTSFLNAHQFYCLRSNVLGADLEFFDQVPGSSRIAKRSLTPMAPVITGVPYTFSSLVMTLLTRHAKAPI
jgi:hypothetical protein